MPQQEQQDQAHHHAGPGQHLGHPQGGAGDDEAVGAQALDEEAAGTVPHNVQQEGLAVVAAEIEVEEVQQHEARHAQQGLVQKAGVHRAAAHHGLGVVADHAPGQIGGGAEGLLVYEVAPAADGLADEEAQGGHIQHGGHLQLTQLGHEPAEHQGPDDAPVDGKAALPDVEDLDGVAPILVAVVKDAVVEAGADDGPYQAHQHRIDEAVGVHVHLLAGPEGVAHPQQEAQGDEDAVPAHLEIADGEGHFVYRTFDPQAGEIHYMSHVVSFLLSCV